jgi:hypothetical protein
MVKTDHLDNYTNNRLPLIDSTNSAFFVCMFLGQAIYKISHGNLLPFQTAVFSLHVFQMTLVANLEFS